MKKTISNILFAALVVLAAASCQKELGSEAQSEGFRTITCYMETPSDTKALGGITPQWVEGAKIWISNGTSSETVTLAEGDITGNNKAIISTSLTGTLYAVYPASAQNGVTEGKIGIKIPTSTDGGFENAHIAVAKGDGTLSFKNAVTILKITTEAATAAVNVASTANISGEFSVTYGESLTVEAGSNPARSVTLTSSEAGAKFVAIAPDAAFNAVTFTAIKSATNWAAKTSTSSSTAAINTVYTVADVSSWTYTDDSNGSLWAQFSVSATKKVRFAKGNLQAMYSGGSYTWAFASNQYDYVGNAAGNTSIGSHDDNAKVDLFGWTVKDKYSDGIKQYGINTSETASDYGDSASDELSDWGTLMGSGWRTPTGGESGEWYYLLNTRSASTVDGTADARYVKATVCEKVGLIIFPDVYIHPSGVTAPTNINTSDAFFAGNTYDSSAWSQMESAGCVFLPAAGIRGGSSVNGGDGHYWSATPAGSDSAYLLYFVDYDFSPADSYYRSSGQSVRLVYSVSN